MSLPQITGPCYTSTFYIYVLSLDVCVLSCSVELVQLFVTLWTVTHQAPLSMGIHQARKLKWVVTPSFRGFPNPGIRPMSPTLQVDSLPSEPPGKPKNTGVGSLSLLQGNILTRSQTGVSCTAGRFFTSRATQETP